MSDIMITQRTDHSLTPISGAPTDYVTLGAVEIKVTKSFDPTTSSKITLNSPSGENIINLINTTTTIYPGTVQIIDVSGMLYIEFNVRIFFNVECASGLVTLLSDTITVQGELGKAGEVRPISSTIKVPTTKAINTGFTESTVYGDIHVGTFSCDICKLKSVKVMIDPTNSTNDPLI